MTSDKTMPELKPCPFCGGELIRRDDSDFNEFTGETESYFWFEHPLKECVLSQFELEDVYLTESGYGGDGALWNSRNASAGLSLEIANFEHWHDEKCLSKKHGAEGCNCYAKERYQLVRKVLNGK